jgi:sigma-B regulation protein RsbU (phosphoserine phosphatase)
MAAQRSGDRRLPTVRAQLLWLVNLSLTAAFAVILVFAYQWELTEHLGEEHDNLESDAAIHHEAISRLRVHGRGQVQDYLDAVASQVSPYPSRKHKHPLLLCLLDGILLAPKNHPPLPDLLEAMKSAAHSPSHRAFFKKEELIVADYSSGDQTVYVAAYVNDLRWLIMRDMLWRLSGIVLLGVLGAAVLNLLLLRLIARPLDRLVATVNQIRGGRLGAQVAPLNSAELDQLAQAVNTMSRSLQEADRGRQLEMARARRIQAHLLPADVRVPGLHTAHLYLPATEVAGDYYDVLPLADGSWLFCIADVTGHGVPAAMTAMMLKALLLLAVESHGQPDELLAFMNRRLSAMALPDDFASVLPATNTLVYASAGHEVCWLTTPEGVRELPATGVWLGPFPEESWKSVRVPVAAGQRLVLVTDGLTEAPNPDKQLFGRRRLSELLAACRLLPFEAVIPRLQAELDAHLGPVTRPDDLTVVLVEFRAPM